MRLHRPALFFFGSLIDTAKNLSTWKKPTNTIINAVYSLFGRDFVRIKFSYNRQNGETEIGRVGEGRGGSVSIDSKLFKLLNGTRLTDMFFMQAQPSAENSTRFKVCR
jgi:hypothetical protein